MKTAFCWKVLLVVAAVMLPGAGIAGMRSIDSKFVDQPVDSVEPVALDLFEARSAYVFGSDFKNKAHGDQDAWQNYITYSHRFPLTGNWYLRLGAEYQRWDFGSSRAPVPATLQALAGVVSFEYVHRNHVGAALEMYPGFYFERDIDSDAFDIPTNLYFTWQINDRLFAVIGASVSMLRDWPVYPIGGLVWLISDDVRLEAIVNRPALVCTAVQDWEFRLAGDFVGGGFRTDSDRGRGEKLDGAVVQYVEYRAALLAAYTGWNPFRVEVGAGYAFSREFDYHRAGPKYELDGAPYATVRLTAEF